MLKHVQHDDLRVEMADGNLLLTPLAEAHRSELKAACAQDEAIWQIFATSYDPEHFDESFDLLTSRPNWQAFAILHAGELAGMSCYIGIDPDRARSRSATLIMCRSCAGPASTGG
jgi:hypothetical protein